MSTSLPGIEQSTTPAFTKVSSSILGISRHSSSSLQRLSIIVSENNVSTITISEVSTIVNTRLSINSDRLSKAGGQFSCWILMFSPSSVNVSIHTDANSGQIPAVNGETGLYG